VNSIERVKMPGSPKRMKGKEESLEISVVLRLAWLISGVLAHLCSEWYH
jgi:hypothetical protein